ncbi:endopeptidase La [Megasphaera butyrica]|uniref:endopeptidase La n=1 Tax=Megasphaera TaxID=906 RepID=UPI0008217E34|nr:MULTISPECIES: endopeptidase La [Megasphaera]SCI12881.1 Lon protease 1 [uncultured Ruminococcus sp.]MCU6713466.1 endopeptidase La [Megasphaera butyrica]NJE34920.1 endopeptidase La [Megasphaera sp. SW808]OUO48449.1 endopeptidase La [Megasphaera sp. An286]SCH01055.1 Lon protease 1 [uncultured Megasphaera sp.]
MDENSILAMPFVPLRGIVVYPKLLSHIDIGREKSLAAVDYAMEHDRLLVVSAQVDEEVDDPGFDDVYQCGTLVRIQQLLRLPGGLVRILVDGIDRVQLQGFSEKKNYLEVAAVKVDEIEDDSIEEEALRRVVLKQFSDWLENVRNGEEIREKAKAIEEPGAVADFIVSQLPLRLVVRQQILEMAEVKARLRRVMILLDTEVEIANLESSLNMEVRSKMDQQQKEYYLREKIKAIHRELGDKVDKDTETQELREKIHKMKLPKKIEEPLLKEVDRLDSMPPMMAESAIIRTYLDLALELPWKKETKDRLDLKEAQSVLDEDHYGLKQVKDRIIEYLAVRQLTHSLKGPILCFVGPPGTGKTSIARSIARAMNRKYVRISLGGVRDEAEIRGHRRTYIGAMPGRIISGLKQAGVKNPVFLLDEIDKMTSDMRGDPSAALLEVLDPEQNNSFADHYLDIPFDLSKVFWITTANVVSDIPRPLLDRMEIIEFTSYTEEEKVQIAKQYLVPKQLKENGLKASQARFSEAVLKTIIQGYTRESGVRTLEKTIGAVCRKVGKSILLEEETPLTVSMKNLQTILGPVKYLPTKVNKADEVGIVTGLAWTQVGGEVLETEAVAVKGKGSLLLTGQLGDVMKESAEAGMTYIRRRAGELGLPEDFYSHLDLHIHLPEGAIPKDGPSAGITMATALASALTGKAVRHDVAMTGEITLRGTVLPVGGIKEKVIAAHRAGIKKILLPEENKRDMDDVPQSVKDDVTFVFVHHMDEVLEQALVNS